MSLREKIGNLAKALHEHHTAEGNEEVANCAKAVMEHCAKADGDADLVKALVPTSVHAINPAPHLTAIPRTGSKPIEKTNIPLEFQKLVAIPDEDGEIA